MVSFFSYYIELPIMLVMYVGWKLLKGTRVVGLREMDLVTDTHTVEALEYEREVGGRRWRKRANTVWRWLL